MNTKRLLERRSTARSWAELAADMNDFLADGLVLLSPARMGQGAGNGMGLGLVLVLDPRLFGPSFVLNTLMPGAERQTPLVPWGQELARKGLESRFLCHVAEALTTAHAVGHRLMLMQAHQLPL
jgi:hypothetical protein